MDVEIIVPIAAFSFVLAVVWILAASGQKKREAVHQTLRLMIEKDQPISSDLLKDMALITSPRRNDLRRGVVLIALALALCFVGLIMMMHGNGDGEALVIAVFPGMIGLAFLALWKFGYDGQAD
ncbi:MAG: DUF6249 domain-containing protein [Hyphomonadaceae bacterium]